MLDGQGIGPYMDKDTLKAALSLAFVCHHYGIVLNEANRALCPWHPDDDPSFRVFVNEEGYQKFHCYPCSEGGDVFDLIRRVEGCTFPEALAIAERLLGDMPTGWAPPPPPAPRGPADWQDELSAARVNAAAAHSHGYLSIATELITLRDDNDLRAAQRLDVTLREIFGWGCDDEGNVHMPHWDRNGALTGCKLRSRGANPRRWSQPGSKFRDLYASWIPRKYDRVLLTEGEKDCGWAYAQIQAEGLPVDVYALPAGAEDDVDPEWLNFIAGAKTVFLAFDADAAGLRATRAWLTALRELNFTDVRVCRLPQGQDLAECKPNITHLLREAVPPRPTPVDTWVENGGFVVAAPTKNNDEAYREITTWHVDPLARLTPGDGEDRLQPGLEVNLVVDGLARGDVISNDDLRSKQNITKWCTPRSLVVHGNDGSIGRISELLHAQASLLPEVFQTSRCGIHRAPSRYSYAGPALVHPNGHIGQLPWKYVHARGADITHHIFVPEGKFDFDWLTHFLALGEPSLTHPLIAWLVAATRRTEVRNFPLCYVGGPSGSGKSTISQLACRMFGSDVNANLGQVTPFVLMTHLSATTTFPVFLDEYTKQSRHSAIEALQSSIPVIYEAGTAERGQQDLNTVSFRLTSPVLIAGEQTFDLDREVQRMVTLRASRRDQNEQALAALIGVPVENFARLFYEWVIARSGHLPAFPTTAPDRPTWNREILRTGWQTLRLFLDDQRQLDPTVPDIPVEPDLSYADVVEAEHENVYESALESIVNTPGLDGYYVVWLDPFGQGTWARFNEVPPLAARALGQDFLPGGGQAIRQYFESKFEVEKQRTLVGGFGTGVPSKKTAYLIKDYFAADAAGTEGTSE